MHANLWIYCLKSRKVLSLYSIMRNTRNMCLWSQTTIISTVLSETFFALARDRLGPVSCPFSLIHFWIADFFSNQGCKSRENCVSKHILVFFPIDKMTYKWGLRLWTYNFSLGSKMLGSWEIQRRWRKSKEDLQLPPSPRVHFMWPWDILQDSRWIHVDRKLDNIIHWKGWLGHCMLEWRPESNLIFQGKLWMWFSCEIS